MLTKPSKEGRVGKLGTVLVLWTGVAQSVQRLAGRSGDRIPGGGVARISTLVQTGPGTHPASCAMDTGSLSPGVKRPGRGVTNPPSSSAVVKESVELYFQPPGAFMACFREDLLV